MVHSLSMGEGYDSNSTVKYSLLLNYQSLMTSPYAVKDRYFDELSGGPLPWKLKWSYVIIPCIGHNFAFIFYFLFLPIGYTRSRTMYWLLMYQLATLNFILDILRKFVCCLFQRRIKKDNSKTFLHNLTYYEQK